MISDIVGMSGVDYDMTKSVVEVYPSLKVLNLLGTTHTKTTRVTIYLITL